MCGLVAQKAFFYTVNNWCFQSPKQTGNQNHFISNEAMKHSKISRVKLKKKIITVAFPALFFLFKALQSRDKYLK